MSLFDSQDPRIYTVSTLTAEIKGLLEDHFDFVWVEGEISNFRSPLSGHYYMVLKDERAQIKTVMFRPQARYLKFVPEDGMKVICMGRIGVYQPRGEYQIILDYLEPLGIGALALAFEQLKRKLAAQGLFDPEIKRPLPFLPQRVAVITSPTGAAIRDFLKVIQRRYANIEIVIVPVKVQGSEAAGDMVAALELVNRELDVDVIVLTRGGGSLEDLWAFNDEKLAHAVRASRIPVVSAVGHEIDVTISDMAADVRAPTPSAAAEILVQEKEFLEEKIREIRERLLSSMNNLFLSLNQSLAFLSKGLVDPRRRISDTWFHLEELGTRLVRVMNSRVHERKKQLISENRALFLKSPLYLCEALGQKISYQKQALCFHITDRLKERRTACNLLEEKVRALSPLAVLRRGYSITRKLPEKKILRDVKGVEEKDRVEVTLAEGTLECRIEKVVKEQTI